MERALTLIFPRDQTTNSEARRLDLLPEVAAPYSSANTSGNRPREATSTKTAGTSSSLVATSNDNLVAVEHLNSTRVEVSVQKHQNIILDTAEQSSSLESSLSDSPEVSALRPPTSSHHDSIFSLTGPLGGVEGTSTSLAGGRPPLLVPVSQQSPNSPHGKRHSKIPGVSESSSTSASGEGEPSPTTVDHFFSCKPRLGTYTGLIDSLLKRAKAGELFNPATAEEAASPFMTESFILKLCVDAKAVLSRETSLLQLTVKEEDTLVVVGDIHGQFQDLYASVLSQQYEEECNPDHTDRMFLFMGDYVDRGPRSLEVVLLLLALKVEYPQLVYLTRGNHEEQKTCRVYGFLMEAESLYGSKVGMHIWDSVSTVFNWLPLAALVRSPTLRFLATHGGLSPELETVEQIACIDRSSYSSGYLTEKQRSIVDGLLWSDPSTEVGTFGANVRGCGCSFGPTTSEAFCRRNELRFICRAHQVAMDGYFWTHSDRVVTVFSAPNYCGVNDNLGAVMLVSGGEGVPIFQQYECLENEEAYPAPNCDFHGSNFFY